MSRCKPAGAPSPRASRLGRLARRRLALVHAALFLFLHSLLAAATDDHSKPGTAVIHLFDAGEAPIKDTVRSVLHTPGGKLIVGSNRLAAFDGYRWREIEVPETYGFRALALAHDSPDAEDANRFERVWVGAIDTIGYVECDSIGRWTFTAVPFDQTQSSSAIGDVWSVHAVDESASAATARGAAPRHGAVWVTSQRILRWNGERLESWLLPSATRLAGFSVGNDAWIYHEGRGLLRIGFAGEPKIVVPESDLPETPLTWLTPLPAPADTLAALVGLRDRAYLRTADGRWTRLERISAELKDTLPTTAIPLHDDRVAIATFNAGIVIASLAGDVLGRIATRQGLPDDSVYALGEAGRHLFAGVPSGLVRIEGAGHAARFDRHRDLGNAAPRKVLNHRGATFVLTSKSVYQTSGDNTSLGPALRLRWTSPAPLWDAASAGGELWLGGFGGIWRLSEDGPVRELHVATDVLQLIESARVPRGLVFTEGYQLKTLTPSSHGGWAAHPLRASVPDTPVTLLEDDLGDVWLSTIKDGIARFAWASAGEGAPLRLEAKTFHRPGRNLPRITRPSLASLGTHFHAFAEQGAFMLTDSGTFRPVPGLENFVVIGSADAGAAANDSNATAFWLVQRKELEKFGLYGVLRVDASAEGNLTHAFVDVPGLDALGPLTRIDRTIEAAGPVLWVSGARGLLRVEENKLRPAPPPLAATLIEAHPAKENRTPPAAPTWTLNTETNNFEFRFDTPTAVGGEPLSFQTRLEGAEDDWSAPQREPRREFSSLAPGRYTFHVRTWDRFGRVGPVSHRAFVVAAPWWRRPAAYAVYGVLLALAVAGAARWRILRLKRQNERLNRLVGERTRELELSSTAKSEFLENISHEIRNPLNGLGGLLELMKEDTLAPRERELARSLKAVAGTLTRVFEDVLEFSKLEYGYARLHRKPFSLRAALDDVCALFAVSAERQGCALRVEWPPELADGFSGDEQRIRTIVGNFVGNALKYAPGAPIDIRVTSTAETAGLVDLYIDVVDHGPGIPPDEQGLIFKKFVRGSDAKRKEIAGTGLGLATCHALARLMNGNVGVESIPGQGAMFYLRLLLPRAPLPADAPEAVAVDADAPDEVLIVDDESYNRTVLEGVALQLGFRPTTAGDAPEAMRRLGQRDYAIVFMDWELPGPKGGDVCKYIRTRPGGERPIILATTAHDSDEMQERCREAGMDGFLRKPFNAEKVRRAIAGVREWRATRAVTAVPGDTGTRAGFWSEQRRADGTSPELNLEAFAQYALARPHDPSGARRDFLLSLDAESNALKRALAASDTKAIAGLAHRLRALAGLIGAKELNAKARRLEELARHGQAAGSATEGRAVLAACAHLEQQLGTQA